MGAVVDLIQRVGFPVATCLWFMLRQERKTDKQTEVLNEMVILLRQVISEK
jgi:hypothetical protein